MTEDSANRRADEPPWVTADSDTGDTDEDDQRSLLPRWLPQVPEEPAGWWASARADPGRAGMITLGAVALIAVLVTAWSLLRDDTPPVSAVNLPPVAAVSSAAPITTAAPEGPVVVSIVGLVTTPGVVTLAPGARVADALAAAGGALARADTTGLNMARPLADGEQVVVGIAAASGQRSMLGSSVGPGDLAAAPAATSAAPGRPTAPGKRPAAAPKPDGPVNLNTATVEELDTLPGVGPVTAEAIIAWRDAHGAFTTVDQLAEVDGIGAARLARLREHVRV